MTDYIRKINYHETDKMGVTHHSNYIKFMEEARIHFLDEIGFGYSRLESLGLMSPVLGVECQYKKYTTFDDEIKIHVSFEEFNGAKFIVSYKITNNKTGELVLTGKTIHCFVDKTGKLVILKKYNPELNTFLTSLIFNNEDNK